MFQTLQILHYNFIAAILFYFVVGESLAHQVEDFKSGGFVDFGTATIWAMRGFFVITSVVGLTLTYTIFSDEKFIAREMSRSVEVTDCFVAASLQSAHIVRLAFTEAIAIYGLNLFIYNGHRYDLYGFGIVALLNLIALRPSRDKWEETYRRAAPEYPGVSTVPW